MQILHILYAGRVAFLAAGQPHHCTSQDFKDVLFFKKSDVISQKAVILMLHLS